MKLKFIFLLVFQISFYYAFSQSSDSVFTSLEAALKNKEQVKYLKLNRKQYRVFPSQIFEFTNLAELDISKNKIAELPDSIAVLTQLKKINISQNKLKTLPKTIGSLSYLQDIRAAQNEITTLPVELSSLLNLTVLDLWSNNIVEFPVEYSKLTQLKELDVRGIVFTESQEKKLKELLSNTKIYFSPGCNCGK